MNNKKSFVLYNDQEELFTELSNEQAGLLIKSIFKYNKNGELPTDPIIKLIFISIKQTLIRDNEKWLNIVQRNQDNGKLGGRPSLNNNPDKPKEPSGLSGNPEEPKKPVSVSVSESVSVSKHIPAHEVQVTAYKRLSIEKATLVQRLVYHLEDTLNTSIVNWGKQGKAVSSMIRAGYTEEQIKKTITYMATKDDFFLDKGFDLTTVSSQISRYKAQSNKNGLQ
jgi:hypothetical protein